MSVHACCKPRSASSQPNAQPTTKATVTRASSRDPCVQRRRTTPTATNATASSTSHVVVVSKPVRAARGQRPGVGGRLGPVSFPSYSDSRSERTKSLDRGAPLVRRLRGQRPACLNQPEPPSGWFARQETCRTGGTRWTRGYEGLRSGDGDQRGRRVRALVGLAFGVIATVPDLAAVLLMLILGSSRSGCRRSVPRRGRGLGITHSVFPLSAASRVELRGRAEALECAVDVGVLLCSH